MWGGGGLERVWVVVRGFVEGTSFDRFGFKFVIFWVNRFFFSSFICFFVIGKRIVIRGTSVERDLAFGL